MAQLNPKKATCCGRDSLGGKGEVMGFMPRRFPECLVPGRPGGGAGGDGQILLIPALEEISRNKLLKCGTWRVTPKASTK